jgi:hypothetical protein
MLCLEYTWSNTDGNWNSWWITCRLINQVNKKKRKEDFTICFCMKTQYITFDLFVLMSNRQCLSSICLVLLRPGLPSLNVFGLCLLDFFSLSTLPITSLLFCDTYLTKSKSRWANFLTGFSAFCLIYQVYSRTYICICLHSLLFAFVYSCK